MKWILKAFIQKSVSILPFSHRMNYAFQSYVSVGKELPHTFVLERLNHAKTHLQNFEKFHQISFENAKILEIGMGWYPIVPIAFYLAGANDIESSDVRSLYSKDSINKTIRAFLLLQNNNSLSELIPGFQHERMANLSLALSEKDLSKKFNILRIKPFLSSTGKLNLESDIKDFITSNNTFQFVKKDELPVLISELHRILKPNAFFSVAIDFTDEFSHFDSTISNYNFLKFSQRKWNMFTCSLNATNRLRCSDYQKLFATHFQIVFEEFVHGNLKELENLELDEQFKPYEKLDLLVKHGFWVARLKMN